MAKEYIRPMSRTWYLGRATWRRFILRELTSVFVGAYSLFLLYAAVQARSEDSFAALFACIASPWALLFHVPVFLMATFHTVTWFAAAPKALRVYRGEERVPERVIAGAHFAAWLAVSAIVAWVVLG